MDLGDIALIAGGVVGGGTAVGHGILLQRVMVQPIEALAVPGSGISANIRRLVPSLLHFSTFNWFVSGLALIVAVLWLGPEAKLTTAVLAASSFIYGSIGNYSATRGRHYGWKLMAVAVVFVIVGIVTHAA